MRASKLFGMILLVFAAAFSEVVAQSQYSIGSPTNEQQYMLELINRARADGAAEAARLQGTDNPPFSGGLQEGPPSIGGEAWTISNTNQPLSWNPQLFNAAQGHATNLNNNDQFFLGGSPHTFGGTTPQQRIAAAGYPDGFQTQYNGPTTQSGFVPGPENIATRVTSPANNPFTGPKLIDGVLRLHNGLFTDVSVPGRGHRSTTMLGFWREIGIGIAVGTDNGQGTTWDSLYIVQNFGTQTNSTPFVTGVVHQDTNGNSFYDPGEGVGGVRVDVAGSNFFAISSSSGGYSVPVPGNGSYNVTFSGGGLANNSRTVNVANSLNAKSDYVAGASATPTVLANISTRLRVETGDNLLIAGFIITGSAQKKVIIRAIGPSLTLAGKLGNPTLELRNSSGGLVASNDDWRVGGPSQEADVIATGIPPSDNLESAIVATLPANGANYTAQVRGVNNATGVAVVEVYDLNTAADSELANISTRGLVQTDDNVLFAGMIVVGPGSQNVLIRAIGPSLPSSVPGRMEDPTLQLRDANGALLEENDDWKDSPNRTAIENTTIPPSNDRESAIVRPLPAGNANYTAIVRGFNNTTGIAVVEVYALP